MIPLKDTILRQGFSVVTWVIILLNGIIFLYEISIPKDILQQLFYLFGLVPARYSYPSWAVVQGLPFDHYLSFVTAMFLHAGWLHIIGNMWFLYVFGGTVEDRLGHVRFLFFYLLAGLGASLIYFLIDIHSRIPEFGASGAIAGVMGAYIVLFPRARIFTMILIFFFPFFVELSAFFYIGYWFLIQLFAGTISFAAQATQGGVAWWAHVGGFVAGIVLVLLFRRHAHRKSYPDEVYHYLSH
jgi:membrane associated rhomboid family serine protease